MTQIHRHSVVHRLKFTDTLPISDIDLEATETWIFSIDSPEIDRNT